jgi:hypothetical protein
MRIPQRAGAAAPAVRPARRFSIGRGGEAGSAACARIRARDAPADVMEIENLIRYTALAVGLKPSASQGEARLRGLYRLSYSTTITSALRARSPTDAGLARSIRTRQRGRGSALCAISPTVQRRAEQRTAA